MNNEEIKYTLPGLYLRIHNIDCSSGKPLLGMHFHNAVEIVAVTSGRVCAHFDTETTVLDTGSILFINRCVVHALEGQDAQTRFSYLQIDIDRYLPHRIGEAVSSLDSFIHGSENKKYLIFGKTTEAAALCTDIMTEYAEKRPCFEGFIKADIYRIAAIAQRERLWPHKNPEDSEERLAKIAPAIRFAEESFTHKITLDDASRVSQIDRFYFCKLFKSITGGTFIDYVNFLRLRKAEDLLTSTDKTVTEIAYECGFCSVQYFNKRFQKKNNCLPSVYRRLHRG